PPRLCVLSACEHTSKMHQAALEMGQQLFCPFCRTRRSPKQLCEVRNSKREQLGNDGEISRDEWNATMTTSEKAIN
ncbi:hypothetical protein PMAYCL1PPCAC_32111, partial [Pristionchus mayeri]